MKFRFNEGLQMKDIPEKLYAMCPYCGKFLCKVKPGSEVEDRCNVCSIDFEIIVDEENRITTRPIFKPAKLNNRKAPSVEAADLA